MYRGRYVKGEYDTGTILHVSRKAMDRFQYTWVAMIGEIYKLIAKLLGNGFK